MIKELQQIKDEFLELLHKIISQEALNDLKIQFLGKKGKVASLMKEMTKFTAQEKAEFGKHINQIKNTLQKHIEDRAIDLKKQQFQKQIEHEWIDISLNELEPISLGSLHPITMVQYQLEDIFTAMGFQILDGPHIETEYYNFEALNIPPYHPARDLQDTFFFEDGNLLRTQTSTIQIRGMENLKPPFRIIGPGKVFRCERSDASHESCFHQLEGMLVDQDISVAHLIYFMKTMLSEIFQADVKVRLRPGYFPFVEPGFELEMGCLLCEGNGCPMCKNTGWIELLGCGMVHPNVLKHGNIDPIKYSGFAFGLGLDRLTLMKYGIKDIRYLHSGDLNFACQFTN